MQLTTEQSPQVDGTNRLAAVGENVSSLLHDLRGPMAVIAGYSELLARAEDDRDRAQLAEIIRKQCEWVTEMAAQTMAFARGEAPVLLTRVYLDPFAEEVRQMLAPRFAGTGVCLSVSLRSSRSAVFDRHLIKRMIANIAQNAIEAMPSGGSFGIIIVVEGSELIFRFEDTGPGIPPGIADRLFQTFASYGKDGGTGLGLASVKRVAEAHGGTVSVQSAPEWGTAFEVRIPLRGEH